MDFREMFNRHLENMYYSSRVYTKLDKDAAKVITKPHDKEDNK